jgi:hypothetical protein
MVRPDPGRDLHERMLSAMGPADRARIGQQQRWRASLVIWQQLDERGLDDPVEQAEFILRRRYPEMPEWWFGDVVAKLRAEHASGRWKGFERPGTAT